jgi:glycosyltransferase involved in cell wall biosynthesis
MKCLYIGHYYENSGWGFAARQYIKALLSVGIDVVCRPIVLAGGATLSEDILVCEEKPLDNCDVCIQHVLPHYLVYSSKFKKNVCIYATETSNFISSGWSQYINLMDEAWVICNQQVEASRESGVIIPIKVVPHATDVEKYSKPRVKMDLGGDFIFYTISEWNTRKNIPAIIRAFHSEFDPSEPVRLLIKTNSSHFTPDKLAEEVLKTCNKVKGDLRLYPNLSDYKGDYIQTNYLSEDELMNLHYSCDSFVTASYGEAWNYPCFDAMGFGKFPLSTNIGGMADFIQDEYTGRLIEGHKTLVSSVNDTLPNLFTGREKWTSISIPELQMEMRQSYIFSKDKEYQDNVKRYSKIKVNQYSYNQIGNLMKNNLEWSL